MRNVIYKIRIEGCERFYIGSAVDFKKRRLHHLSELRRSAHNNRHLQRIFEKYGEDSFSFQILEEVSKSEYLLEAEQKWIDKFDFSLLINICQKAGNTLGRKHTESAKQKISENHHDVSGENNPMFGKRGNLSPNYGKSHSEETKRKISEATKGRESVWKDKKRPEHSELMAGEGNPFYGKNHSDEARAKISSKAKERVMSRGGQKINIDIAREIRARYNEGGVTTTALAKEYGLSRTYCGKLLKGEYWNED